MFWIAQMGDQSTPKIVGHKIPSSATILARQRKDLVSPSHQDLYQKESRWNNHDTQTKYLYRFYIFKTSK